MAGFDTITNHLSLILFSIGLDILLWFGPQLDLSKIIASLSSALSQTAQGQPPQLADMVQTNFEAFQQIAVSFFYLSAWRLFPVGLSTLLAGGAPLENPIGAARQWQVASLGSSITIWLALAALGLLVGTLYFSLVSQAALAGKITVSTAVGKWLGRFGQVVLLSIFWIGLLLAISLPLSCALLVFQSSGGLGNFVFFVYTALILWLFFPLLFSPYGIFIHDDSMWASVLRGARLARLTMPVSLFFIIAVLILSQGLDMLWSLPASNSWFTLVGVIGHAFIAAGLLAATFIFYRDAGIYVQQRLQMLKT